MPRSPFGVFCVISVERFGNWLYFDDPEHPVPHRRAGQLLARDESFSQQRIAVRPVFPADLLRRMRAILLDDDNAEGRSLVDRFQHVRRLEDMAARGLMAIDRDALRDRHAGGLKDGFGEVLLHRKRRCEHAGMRSTSSTPWMVPSSPTRPCRALKATSGLRRARVSAMERSTSMRVTR